METDIRMRLIPVRTPITAITLLNTFEHFSKFPLHIAISRVPTVAAPNNAKRLKYAITFVAKLVFPISSTPKQRET
jgi:hypothetical protein